MRTIKPTVSRLCFVVLSFGHDLVEITFIFQLEVHLCHASLKSINGESIENGDANHHKTLMFQFCDIVRCHAKVRLKFSCWILLNNLFSHGQRYSVSECTLSGEKMSGECDENFEGVTKFSPDE